MGVAASVRADVCTEWIEAFTSMRLANQEIEKLHNVFTHVDFNGSGSIDAAEMLAFLDIDRTSLSKRLFVNCDRDDNGQMNFYEFVLCCWKLLALKQKSLHTYVFDLYDLDGDGELTAKEFMHMIHELDSHFADTASATIHKWFAEATKSKCVNAHLFGEFCSTHQTLLHSIHDLRTRLKDRVMGAAFWDSVSDRDIVLMKNKTATVAQLLELHSDRASFDALLNHPEVQSNRSLCNLLESLSCANGPATPVGSLKEMPARRERRRTRSPTTESALAARRKQSVPSLAVKKRETDLLHSKMFGAAPLHISSS